MTKDITELLAEDITAVLDYLSRVIGATDDGGSHYLHEKAAQLARATQRLHEHLSARSQPGTPIEWDRDKRFSPTKLNALVARDARHYAAGRALYPAGGDVRVAERRAALEAAANALPLADLDLTPAQHHAVTQWLLARAEDVAPL
jgi:hypothetical protein